MRKAVAIVSCLAILSLCAPTVSAATPKPLKDGLKFVQKPITWLLSFFPFIPFNETLQSIPHDNSPHKNLNKVMITGDLPSHRTGGGD